MLTAANLPAISATDNSGLVYISVDPPAFRNDQPISENMNVVYTAEDSDGNSVSCAIQIVISGE